MMIRTNENKTIFQINTPNTTYMMGVGAGKYLIHLYYGKRIEDMECEYLLRMEDGAKTDRLLTRDKVSFFETYPFEYPAYGTGDYRNTCLSVRDEGGFRVCELIYDGFRIYSGKPALEGLPATFEGSGKSQKAETLEICLKDERLELKILLRYSVFEDSDAILRSVTAVNEGEQSLVLEKILSACLDLDNERFELTTLNGAWSRERHIVKRDVTEGKFSVDSLRGRTSHQAQPFLMLTEKGTTENQGNVYAMNFIYSGNFIAEAELNFQDNVRMTMGIHPETFEWVLNPGEAFVTPEVSMVYSSQGIGTMTRCFHDLYRNHLIRSKYLHRNRPIPINNWEATYFNFDEDKLLDIAREAKKIGVEMLVMDDGWFGKRDNDESSLGDWYVNREKIKSGLPKLVERINQEGLKFGIWFEPEMVSPDSDLYRAHPDWAIKVLGKEPTMHRHQYVLDYSRTDVTDYVYECLASILRSANIEYVKWDMNRPLSDLGSSALEAEHMGEFCHRYLLGLYRMQERLVTEFPEILLENCCGGGGRFDAGMLYYSPQIWTSDNMDPIERLYIQEGTALIYPLSTMGAHVCACPNRTNGRITPLETRAYVAMAGTFGYELDVTKMSEDEKKQALSLTREFKKYQDLCREGDYYRIASCRENGMYDCWQVIKKDRSGCLVTYVQLQSKTKWKPIRLRLEDLEPKAKYQLEGTDQLFSGEVLMNAGFLQEGLLGDYKSRLLYFIKIG